MVLGVIIAVIGIIIGWDSGRREFASPPTVNAQTTRKPWIAPAIKAYLIIYISVFIEAGVAHLLRLALGMLDIYFFKLLSMVVENGIGVVILWPFVFKLFDKRLREAGIDNQKEYSETASKISASLLVWIVCIILLIRFKDGFDASNSNSLFFFNRIIMWLIAPLGEFIIFQEKKTLKKERVNIKEKWHSISAFLRKNSPIIIGMVCAFVFVFFSFWYQEVALEAIQYFFLWLAACTISYGAVKTILSPSLNSSKKRFIRKASRRRNKGRFGWMNYEFIDHRLTINAVKVENPKKDKDEEFEKLFGKIVKEDCDKEEALKILEERFTIQHQYMESVVNATDAFTSHRRK